MIRHLRQASFRRFFESPTRKLLVESKIGERNYSTPDGLLEDIPWSANSRKHSCRSHVRCKSIITRIRPCISRSCVHRPSRRNCFSICCAHIAFLRRAPGQANPVIYATDFFLDRWSFAVRAQSLRLADADRSYRRPPFQQRTVHKSCSHEQICHLSHPFIIHFLPASKVERRIIMTVTAFLTLGLLVCIRSASLNVPSSEDLSCEGRLHGRRRRGTYCYTSGNGR